MKLSMTGQKRMTF